jgi:hypothetical protein
MNDSNTTQTTEFVYRRLAEPLQIAGQDYPGYWWLVILCAILALGFFYVAWMYVRDSKAIGPLAILLALLRCSVYGLLAYMFLLPAKQTWEETRSQSRVLVLYDASLSMSETREGIPTDNTPLEKLPFRQDNVLQFVNDPQVNFLKRLQDKNPVFAYRFARGLDEDFHALVEGEHWTRSEWEKRGKPKKEGEQDSLAGADQKARPPLDWFEFLKPNHKAPPPDGLNKDAREAFAKKQQQFFQFCNGTNLGEALKNLLAAEGNNMLQGIVVFTDGRSTEGSDQALIDVRERAKKANIPIFMVGVGEDRVRAKLELADVRVPEQIRPDDHFKMAVDLTGIGLEDKEVPFVLDVTRVVRKGNKDEEQPIALIQTKSNGEPIGQPMILPTTKITIPAKVLPRFKPGNPPRAQVEYTIDPETLAKAAGGSLPAGKWELYVDPKSDEQLKFVARVPRQPGELFAGKEHVSEPALVRVVKKPLRVLLVTSGAQREYQFLRTLLVREMKNGRVDLCIYLQPAPEQPTRRPGIVADVDPDRLLSTFPTMDRDESEVKPDEKYYNLASYDAIVAFDPDWTRLGPEQLGLLEKWVGSHGGGLILVGGPVNTVQLARPGINYEKLRPLLDLYPVVLQDVRIQQERKADEPWRLNFPGANPEMEFLNLEENPENPLPLDGWEQFFTNGKPGEPGKTVVRGFFNFYPVLKAKEGATVVATFTDPRAKTEEGKEMPFLVTAPYGGGKVVWLGAGEMWRLREKREAYLERFWTKLTRYAGANNTTRASRRITPVSGRTYMTNTYVQIDAQIFGKDMNPLPKPPKLDRRLTPDQLQEEIKRRPHILIKPPVGVNEKEYPPVVLLPQESGDNWNGWFTGKVLVKHPGDYEYTIKEPETGDTAQGKFTVKESNPETDNPRPDFDTMYALASDAADVLNRITDEQVRRDVREHLVRPPLSGTVKFEDAGKDSLRLYFDLANAKVIPDCMKHDEAVRTTRGKVEDLWDKGLFDWEEGWLAPLGRLMGLTNKSTVSSWGMALGLVIAALLFLVLAVVLTVLSLVVLARGKKPEIAAYILFPVVLLLATGGLYVFLVLWSSGWDWNALWTLGFQGKEFAMSFAMGLVVLLLGIEWLMRKLSRLA